MDTQPQQPTPILEIAWTRFAQLDAISSKRTKKHLTMRRWIASLGVFATLFAILSQSFPMESSGLVGLIIRGLLILLPILASGIAAFTSTNYSNGDWLVSRAGAEEILKEIYSYRTILQGSPDRRGWLEKRLVEIQRSVYRGLNGELTMEAYTGPLPPHYDPENPASDWGFNDITGDDYFRYRLEQQLNWHSSRVVQRQAERRRLQAYILIAGGAGVFMAAILPIWVALTASLTAALIGWQELRNLDAVVRNYSKVRMELGILYDHWKSLEEKEKTQSEFFNMVRSTEEILWSQNVEYIKSMQEALKESDLEEEASLINRVIKEARESDRRLKQSMEDVMVDFTREKMEESEEILTEEMENALNELSKEASSDLVRAELEAMQKSIQEHFGGLKATLAEIAEEFAGIEIGSNTPPAVLNNLLTRYPKTQEPKG